jgi:ATP-dependent protease HslVU (ClpYQ) peptidase subunit
VTCIVGITDGTRVVIGGDSAGVSGWDVTPRADSKVWVKGEMAFGFTTSFRMGQLLRYRLEIPAHPEDMSAMEYMSTRFIDAARQCLEDGGWKKAESGRDDGGQFLVGYRGHLYGVEADFQIEESLNMYGSIGSGAPYALGALHAVVWLPADNIYELDDWTKRALIAASHYCASVIGPFNLVSVTA